MNSFHANKLLAIAVAVSLLAMAAPAVLPVRATTPFPYNLNGVWQFNDVGYIHAMLINQFNPSTGAFSGEGFYTGGTYTWTITGTEDTSGNIAYTLTVVTGAPGCTIVATGSVTSPTTMSGTGTQSCYGPVTWSATRANQVMNIAFKVNNDEDSGFVGYWAIDNINRLVQVWQDPTTPTNFYVFANYAGSFTTFAGACSPMTGATETATASGTFQGGYFGMFSDSVDTIPSNGVANGNLGTFDFGGTQGDILLCSYGAGQTGPTSAFDWFGYYFPSGTSFNEFIWGWTYTTRDRPGSTPTQSHLAT